MCADNQELAELQDQVRQALKQFHHRAYLASCPLSKWKIVHQRLPSPDLVADSLALGQAVQAVLSDAIEALKPTASRSFSTPAWRAYHILDMTFRQQKTAVHIQADHLHLGHSQYYRELRNAVADVARLLKQWEKSVELGQSTEAAQAAGSRWIVNLPAPTYSRLFGVNADTAAIVDSLTDQHGRWLVVVDGLGGSGKTALARHAACQALESDHWAGVVWETAQRKVFAWGAIRPLDQPALTANRLLDSIALQIDLPLLPHLPTVEKRRALRTALHQVPYLIIIDNLETAVDYQAVAEELWALTKPSKVLVTSRHRLSQYDPATSVHLQALDRASGCDFIRYHAVERGITAIHDAGDTAADRIWQVTGGNPLAIKLVIGQAATRPLDLVLGDLARARGSTEQLYHFIYQAAWQMLSLPARQVLLSMPHLAVSGGPWAAVAAISGLAGEPLVEAVEELVALSLLDVTGGTDRRYSIHQLTCNFVISDLVGLMDGKSADDEGSS